MDTADYKVFSTQENVTTWLKSFNMGQYTETFSTNCIVGQSLLELTSQELKEDLGIKPLGHRKHILREIKILKGSCEKSIQTSSDFQTRWKAKRISHLSLRKQPKAAVHPLDSIDVTDLSQDCQIDLNVGGTIFSASLRTLLREPDSFFGYLFSGYLTVIRDDENRIFIDRDGTYFRHILNYLRDGTTMGEMDSYWDPPPDGSPRRRDIQMTTLAWHPSLLGLNRCELVHLHKEVKFYRIKKLDQLFDSYLNVKNSRMFKSQIEGEETGDMCLAVIENRRQGNIAHYLGSVVQFLLKEGFVILTSYAKCILLSGKRLSNEKKAQLQRLNALDRKYHTTFGCPLSVIFTSLRLS